MKKTLSLLLALALLFSLSGCIAGTEPGTLPADAATANTTQTAGSTASTEETGSTVQPQTQPATQPETRPQSQPETQPATQPATRPQSQPETQPSTQPETQPETQPAPLLDKDGSYTTKEDVALYIHLYGCLPDNFMTKSEARALGWRSGALEPYAPGCCIGGDTFQNREGLLPKAPGRTYKECDIDTMGGGSRGAKRIVFSNDGLVYYTDDHYASFTLLYGEP